MAARLEREDRHCCPSLNLFPVTVRVNVLARCCRRRRGLIPRRAHHPHGSMRRGFFNTASLPDTLRLRAAPSPGSVRPILSPPATMWSLSTITAGEEQCFVGSFSLALGLAASCAVRSAKVPSPADVGISKGDA